MAGLVGLVALQAILSTSPFLISLQAAAVVLFVWARIAFGWRSYHVAANATQGGLVTSGPYRYMRHPIYTALCGFALAGVASHWSLAAGACVALIIVSAAVRIFCEEILITARYPEYSAYAARTSRLIPFIF